MLRRYSYNKPVVQILINSFCFIFGAFMLSSIFLAKESIEKPFLIIEIACGCVYIGGISISTRIKNVNQLLFCIFCCSFIVSFAVRIFFLDYYKVAYGLAVDSYTYDAMVLPLKGNFSYLINNINIDDLGYPYILYQVYKVAGDAEFGRVLMLLLNSSLLVLSSGVLYRLSFFLGFQSREAIIAAGLYGFNPFLYITSSVGLKEVIFCFLIISSLYYMFRWRQNKDIVSFVLCVCFIISTLFFRTAISLMLLICLGVYAISSNSNKKRILCFLAICGICSPIFANYILELFTGISIEKLMAITQARNRIMGSELMGPIVQVLAALIGPFPNFFRLGQYAMLFSSGILLKSILNIFFFVGVWKVVYNLNYKFYPLVLYSLFGIVSVVLAGVSLDMRFVITFLPSTILVSLYAIHWIKRVRFIYYYLIFLVIITAAYNVR